jgi:hypothetical protein
MYGVNKCKMRWCRVVLISSGVGSRCCTYRYLNRRCHHLCYNNPLLSFCLILPHFSAYRAVIFVRAF